MPKLLEPNAQKALDSSPLRRHIDVENNYVHILRKVVLYRIPKIYNNYYMTDNV